MPKTERVAQLEKEIADVRYHLIIKGSQLRFLKNNPQRIAPLTDEVRKLREQLNELNTEIIKYKIPYLVSYEISTKNIYTGNIDHDNFTETLLLDEDFDIDLPKENDDWEWDKKGISKFLLEVLTLLKHKYDEVTLLSIRRLKK